MLEKIKCKKTNKGKSQMTSGNAFQITLSYNGKRCGFLFNDNYLNESNKNDFVYCLLSDADAYTSSRNFEDFCNMFGYDNDSRKALKAFNGCKKQAEKVRRLFNDEEVETLRNELEKLGF